MKALTACLRCRLGARYSRQDRDNDPRLGLASTFAVRCKTDTVSLIGLVDRIIELTRKGDNISYIRFDRAAPATFLIGAVEFRLRD